MRRHNAGLRLTPEKQLQEGDYIESLKVELPPGQTFVTEIGWWMVVVVVGAFSRKISFSFKSPLFIKALVHKISQRHFQYLWDVAVLSTLPGVLWNQDYIENSFRCW